MLKRWDNVTEWTDDIPMSFLPYFMYLVAKEAHYECYFEDYYPKFLEATGLKDSESFKAWCEEQHTHYYECGH